MGAGVEIDAGLSVTIGRLTETLTRVQQWLERSSAMPKYQAFAGSATADSAGNASIQLGPVAQGRRWIVHQAVVGGLTWGTTATGKAVLAVMSAEPSADVAVPLTAVQDDAASLPWVAHYSRGQFVVPPLSSVWVQVTGGTSGQQYAAAVSLVDEPAGS